jgi:hypothetical protein
MRSKIFTQLAGFEPTRRNPIGFQVQRLNHSATTAHELGGRAYNFEASHIQPQMCLPDITPTVNEHHDRQLTLIAINKQLE